MGYARGLYWTLVAGLLWFETADGQAEPVQMAALAPVETVQATAITASELARLAARLGDNRAAERQRAFEELTRLPADSLASIRKRLSRLAEQRPPLPRVLSIMTQFRTVQGVRRADAPVDLAAGILRVLAERRSDELVAAAEPLLLLRSLESIGTPAAAEVALDVFALDDRAWRWESRRTLRRFGTSMLPALIVHETRHPKSWVRRFCRFGIDELGLRKPGLAVQNADVTVLAALIRAYGHTLSFDAMPVVASYLTDERILLRQAARAAITRFGRNAIWQIREAYLFVTGKDADSSWSHSRALEELYAFHDAPRRERLARALAHSADALERGDQTAAHEALARALRAAPTDDALEAAAPAYAKLGANALHRDDLVQAELDYRRALRLHPRHPEAPKWRAQLGFIEAEQRLAQGLFDVAAYEHTLGLSPDHEGASRVLRTLSADAREQDERLRRLLAWVAAALLLAAGLALLRKPPSTESLEDLEIDGETSSPSVTVD